MLKKELVERIDPSLIFRLSALSPATQRWLKTAVQSIRTMPAGGDRVDDVTPPEHLRRLPEGGKRKASEEPGPPTLEDVITGKRKLEEAEQYPELAEELEGIGEVIDMLRGLGESRRKRGEQILRDEILRGEREEDEDDFSF
jgi:hypothetical protein